MTTECITASVDSIEQMEQNKKFDEFMKTHTMCSIDKLTGKMVPVEVTCEIASSIKDILFFKEDDEKE